MKRSFAGQAIDHPKGGVLHLYLVSAPVASSTWYKASSVVHCTLSFGSRSFRSLKALLYYSTTTIRATPFWPARRTAAHACAGAHGIPFLSRGMFGVCRCRLMLMQPPGSMGGTYVANAVSCASAVSTIQAMRDDGVLANANLRGRQLMDGIVRMSGGGSGTCGANALGARLPFKVTHV